VADEPARRISLTITNELSEFGRITPRVLSFLDEHAVHHTVGYFVRVAVEELVVNVVRHGYDDDRTHEINLELEIDDNGIVVRVDDDGRPFDPRGVPEPDLAGDIESRTPGGWGVHLVRSTANEILYQRRGDRNHVEVRINRTPPKTLRK
jgi:anti-sigma regulatory factor (Ser/Thr protein kinase)